MSPVPSYFIKCDYQLNSYFCDLHYISIRVTLEQRFVNHSVKDYTVSGFGGRPVPAAAIQLSLQQNSGHRQYVSKNGCVFPVKLFTKVVGWLFLAQMPWFANSD